MRRAASPFAAVDLDPALDNGRRRGIVLAGFDVTLRF